MMHKETIIGAIAEIASDGEFAGGAIDVLHEELEEIYLPVEIANILKVVQRCKKSSCRKRYYENMYILLRDRYLPITHVKNINEWVSECGLFDLRDT